MRSDLEQLAQAIESRSVPIAVVGLGYVGLPVAAILAGAGHRVIGIDRQTDRVEAINQGENPIKGREPGLTELLTAVRSVHRLEATTEIARAGEAAIVYICVDTPVDADHHPRFVALRSACEQLAGVLSKGAVVVVESTLAPGTIDSVVRPALEGAGRRSGRDFHVAHCPERVMPGRLLNNMRRMARVIGADDPEVAEVLAGLYAQYVEAELDLGDCLTAELVKTAENAYRDVNIAFANQLALICEAAGGDVWRVRELVNKSPGRNVLLPGAGVGGHCIPKDSWLLATALGDAANRSFLAAARSVNDGMPVHVAELTARLLAQKGRQQGARVTVLGYSYLEDSDDTRNSPTAVLLPRLAALGVEVRTHDPYVPEHAEGLDQKLAGTDCIVLMVAHAEYRHLPLPAIARVVRTPLFLDARRVFSPAELASAGFEGRVLGVGIRPAPGGLD